MRRAKARVGQTRSAVEYRDGFHRRTEEWRRSAARPIDIRLPMCYSAGYKNIPNDVDGEEVRAAPSAQRVEESASSTAGKRRKPHPSRRREL